MLPSVITDPGRDEDTGEVTIRMPAQRVGGGARQSVATLRVLAGRDMLRFVSIAPGEQILIGRDDAADLHLSDPTVSKRHARVIAIAEGRVVVQDLGSTNGTAVNHSLVRRAELQPGDHLEVGGVSMRLELLSTDELGHLGRVLARIEAANRDRLTGLLTRVWLDEELPALSERCERSSMPFTCVFVDVDHFKRINDQFGHNTGDEVLANLSRILMLGVREQDHCVRHGGEELLLFLPGTDEDGGEMVAERIRATIAAHDWARVGRGLSVTASFGAAQRRPGESTRDWLARADEALYAAKHGGRNRVVRAASIAR